jgi:uncharacterized protein (DUF1697 family)
LLIKSNIMEKDTESPALLLLRGINVGGNSRLPMETLKDCLACQGAAHIQTYLNSGNAVFTCRAPNTDKFLSALAADLTARIGFTPQMLLLTRGELAAALASNPFPEACADGSNLHLGFLETIPAAPDLSKLAGLQTSTEKWRLIGKVFYLYAPDGVGRSKLAAGAEKALGVTLTDRNWRTARKLLELMEEIKA